MFKQQKRPCDAMFFARTNRGLSRNYIEEKTGVRAVTISKWESGERNPTMINAMKVCNFLDITLDEYMGRVMV